MLVHPTHLVLASATLQMRYFVFIFDQKSSCCFCAFHTSKMNFILQPQQQKSGRRQTQCSSTICGCLCIWPIWCCPLKPFQMRYFVFISDHKSCCWFCAFHTSKMNFILQSQEQKRYRRQIQYYVDVCAPDLSRVVLCNPCIWDILWFISDQKSYGPKYIHFII